MDYGQNVRNVLSTTSFQGLEDLYAKENQSPESKRVANIDSRRIFIGFSVQQHPQHGTLWKVKYSKIVFSTKTCVVPRTFDVYQVAGAKWRNKFPGGTSKLGDILRRLLKFRLQYPHEMPKEVEGPLPFTTQSSDLPGDSSLGPASAVAGLLASNCHTQQTTTQSIQMSQTSSCSVGGASIAFAGARSRKRGQKRKLPEADATLEDIGLFHDFRFASVQVARFELHNRLDFFRHLEEVSPDLFLMVDNRNAIPGPDVNALDLFENTLTSGTQSEFPKFENPQDMCLLTVIFQLAGMISDPAKPY
jgi:hypothetical protein